MSGQVSLIDEHIDNAERCVCCGRVIPEGSHYCIICGMGIPKKQKQIDRIRNMSVEELADFLLDIHCNAWLCGVNDDSDYVFKYNKKWLESEVDNNAR